MKFHSNGNGNGNGNAQDKGGFTQRKIEALLAKHEGIAESLRMTLALLRGDALVMKKKKGHTVLQAAVDLDAQRRTTARQKSHTKSKDKPQSASNIRAQRQASATFLATFDPTTPRAAPVGAQRMHGLGPLVRRGYLRRKGDGYIRTAKEYRV